MNLVITFLYFFALSVFFFIYRNLSFKPYNLGFTLNHFFKLFSNIGNLGEIYLIFVLPLIFSLFIHRATKKGFIVLGGSIIFYLMVIFSYNYFIHNLELGFIPLFLFIIIFPFASLLGLVFRFFNRIKSKTIRIILLILPFLIIFILLSINMIYAENNPLGYCNKFERSGSHVRDSCISDFAIKKNLISFCFKIDVPQTRDTCLERLSTKTNSLGGVDFCKEGTISENSRCYLYFAKLNQDVSLCENIITDQEYDSCYFTLAMLTKDISLCNKIMRVENNNKDICIYNLEL